VLIASQQGINQIRLYRRKEAIAQQLPRSAMIAPAVKKR